MAAPPPSLDVVVNQAIDFIRSIGPCGSSSLPAEPRPAAPDAAAAPAPPPRRVSVSDRPRNPLMEDDNFAMYSYKITPCPRRSAHDWRACLYAHSGESAARRDPRKVPYLSISCPESKAKVPCSRGATCPFAHSAHEFYLHPSRYRTQACKEGLRCRRPICYFAHTSEQLRAPSKQGVSPEQLELLCDSRASLGSLEDSAKLEHALRSCVLGDLPLVVPAGDNGAWRVAGTIRGLAGTEGAAPRPLPAAQQQAPTPTSASGQAGGFGGAAATPAQGCSSTSGSDTASSIDASPGSSSITTCGSGNGTGGSGYAAFSTAAGAPAYIAASPPFAAAASSMASAVSGRPQQPSPPWQSDQHLRLQSMGQQQSQSTLPGMRPTHLQLPLIQLRSAHGDQLHARLALQQHALARLAHIQKLRTHLVATERAALQQMAQAAPTATSFGHNLLLQKPLPAPGFWNTVDGLSSDVGGNLVLPSVISDSMGSFHANNGLLSCGGAVHLPQPPSAPHLAAAAPAGMPVVLAAASLGPAMGSQAAELSRPNHAALPAFCGLAAASTLQSVPAETLAAMGSAACYRRAAPCRQPAGAAPLHDAGVPTTAALLAAQTAAGMHASH